MTIRNWIKTLLSGNPHHIIGPKPDPYLLRWYLIPRNRILNIYLHKFMRSDDDRALHDHPWWFLSLMVRGRYSEVVEGDRVIRRSSPSIAFRRAEHRHRVVLDRELRLVNPDLPLKLESGFVPVWTLVVTGPKVRTWGFWCPCGFVPWREFTSPGNSGEIGKGCGD